MRKVFFVISSLLVFAILNLGIIQKEQTIANGETVFLELAPVDPRSMMQGDYMQLRYSVEQTKTRLEHEFKRGYVVLSLDKNGIGTFNRIYEGGELSSNEKRIRFHNRYNSIHIVPDSFMFQEGDAKLYNQAKYGVFKFDAKGNSVMVGLADSNMQVVKAN